MQQSFPLPRKRLEDLVNKCLDEAPVTVLLGARQTGKTTLARLIAGELDNVHFFDLEQAVSKNALSATPELVLTGLNGTVIIDEVQRLPSLFEVLRPICDDPARRSRFLLLGSASPSLVKGVSESLAGRALFVPIPGFSINETGPELQDRLWLRGSFPRSFLAENDEASIRWREAFITTFLERDLPQLGVQVPAETMRRFWTMTAHYHGQVWNASEIARSIGVSSPPVRRYLDVLSGAYVLRVLPPWFENLKKRQKKSPKVYLRDSGLLHTLLDITDLAALQGHPRYGASWEGFALEQVLTLFGERRAFFLGTQRGAELDLLVFHKGKRIGFEFKCTDAPMMTKSAHIALSDLNLAALYMVYPGNETYTLGKKVEALPLKALSALAAKMLV